MGSGGPALVNSKKKQPSCERHNNKDINMSNTDATDSNYYVAETIPGSGINYLHVKDVTKFYKGMTYGFLLDIDDDTDDEVMEHILDVLKPRLIYSNFVLGMEMSIQEAVGEAHWHALRLDDRKFFSQFKLVKVGDAHIQLLPLS